MLDDKMPKRLYWTVQMVKRLHELHDKIISNKKITEILSKDFPDVEFTTEKVRTKIRRLNLPSHNNREQACKIINQNKKRGEKKCERKLKTCHKDRDITEKVKKLEEEIMNGQYGRKTKLMELTDETCRWPILDPDDKDFCFCGASVEKSEYKRSFQKPVYCERHRSLARK